VCARSGRKITAFNDPYKSQQLRVVVHSRLLPNRHWMRFTKKTPVKAFFRQSDQLLIEWRIEWLIE
jgi:hypothetical protein